MDGWVIVGTKLDSKQLEKDLKDAEKKLQQYERESEKLIKQKVKVEIDLQPYEEQKRLIKETTDEMLAKSQTEEQVKNVLEIEQMQLDDLNSKYSKQLDSLNSVDKKIQSNVKNQELMKNQIDEISKKTKGLDIDFSKISKSTGDVIKKVGRWALAIFSVRGAYSAVRRAMSTLTQYNETLANQLNTINLMFASALEPLITKIVNLVYKLMSYINYIAKAWFGIDLFASATEKAMNKSAKSAKDMRKSLAGFDEMNVLNDNGTTGAMGNVGIEPLPEGEVPEWLEWIAENKDEVIAGLLGIAGAIVSIGTGLSFIQGLGIGAILVGVSLLIQDIKALLEDPTWANFIKVLTDIAIIIGGIMLVTGNWWGLLVIIVAGIVRLVVENWEKIKKKLEEIKAKFSIMWTTIKNGAILAVEKIKETFNKVKTWIKEKIINPIKGFFAEMWEALKGGPKSFANFVIDKLEWLINKLISGMNWLIRQLNKVSFDVPDWVPSIGGKKFGFNLKEVSDVKLPRLEVGGVVNLPGRGVPVGKARTGERGAEGVIPLTNTQMMQQLGQTIGRYITVNNHITTTLNGRVIGRELKRSENESNFAFNK